MRSILIVDTVIFLNVLDVPGWNQNADEVRGELETHINNDVTLLLPVASIIETGNHIAQLSDGNQRRRFAGKFIDQVNKALDGEAPWQPTAVPDTATLVEWLRDFPDYAMREITIADLTLIREWEAARDRHPRHRVRIWSLDQDLTGYDTGWRWPPASQLRRRT